MFVVSRDDKLIWFCPLHRGAKVLKESSRWKKKDRFTLFKTRKPLQASLPKKSGYTVTLKGENLHNDEHLYGPDTDDRIGMYREFTIEDFVDTQDNITFSSKHFGCALVELESRYAPLIPAGENILFRCDLSARQLC